MMDITTRKREEKAMARMRERMQFLLAVTPGVVYSCSPTPPFAATFVAESIEQLGYVPSQFTSEPNFWLDRIHPEDASGMLAELSHLLERGQHVHEYRFQHADGNYVWMRDEMRVIRTKSGDAKEIIGCWMDVSERKRAVELLEERERAYATLLRNLAGMVYRCKNDSDWTATYISDGCVGITGYAPEDLVGNRTTSLGALIHPDDAGWVWERCQASLANKRSCSNEYRIRTASGEEKWVWDQAQGVYDEAGELVFIEGYLSDISDRKSIEVDLKRSREKLETRVVERTAELTLANANLAREISERLRLDEERERLFSIIDQTTDLIGWARPDGQLQYLNRAARKMAGVPDEAEVSQLTIWQRHPHWAREMVEREVMPALSRCGVWQGESALLQHDGTEIPVWEAIHAHRSVTGEIELISTIAHDISARKQAEETLHQLAHFNRLELLGEMASTMAHELNQPLGTIANNARALIRGAGVGQPLPPVTVEVLDDIAADAMRAGEILRSVARFAAKRPAELTLLDVNEVVRDAIQMVEADARRHVTRLEIDLADALPSLYGGKVQIQQVLVNLMRNAFEAVSSLDARDRAVVITTQFNSHVITVSVADSGPGLPDDMLQTIFDPYFTTKPDGLGMGLNISRSIIMSCGGRLQAKRNLERGMTFYFTLPTAGADGAQH